MNLILLFGRALHGISSELKYGSQVNCETAAVEVITTENTNNNSFTNSCLLENNVWKCCVGVEQKLNFTSCISIEYLPNEYGLELNVTFNNYLLIHRKVSAKNPPPICFSAPYLEKIANVCFRFYDLDEDKKTFSGCVRIEGHVEGIKVFKYDIGCFKIPLVVLEKDKAAYRVQFMQYM